MAEDAPPVTPEEQKPKSKLPLKTILIIVGVIALEGGTIVGFKIFSGGAKPAQGSDPIDGSVQAQNKEMAEINLAENFSVDNYLGGKARFVITMSVSARVDTEKMEEFTKLAEVNKAKILDSIRFLVSSAQPAHIKDPKLEVLKREIKIGVEKITGEGIIQEILVSNWQSYDAD